MPAKPGRAGTLWALGAAPALLGRGRWCCPPTPPAPLAVGQESWAGASRSLHTQQELFLIQSKDICTRDSQTSPGLVPGQQGFPKTALTLSQGTRDTQTSPDLVPGQKEFPDSPGLVPGQQRFPKTNPDLVPGHQEFPNSPGLVPGQQSRALGQEEPTLLGGH